VALLLRPAELRPHPAPGVPGNTLLRMRHRPFLLLCVALLALASSSWPVAAATVSTAGQEVFDRQIAPGGFDEVCVRLARDEAIDYRFEASAPVDFNVHYHRGKDVFYPVRESQVRAATAQFRAPAADDYCLMWQNTGAAAVRVQGRVTRPR
jgi:hypothetical protein